MTSPLQIPNLASTDNRLNWSNSQSCSSALAISELSSKSQRPIIVITDTLQAAMRLAQDIEFFGHEQMPVKFFPDWETLPYDHFSPHEDIISDRLSLLVELAKGEPAIILASVQTLMHRVLPKEYLLQSSLVVNINDKFNLELMRNNLVNVGYRNVSQVMEHGEFSLRGSIIDIFPMGSQYPYRIELFDDEIETIRSFDPENQRTKDKIASIHLLPAREFPLSEAGITQFRQSWREKFSGNPAEAPLYQQISHGEAAAGVEYYLPLFYPQTSTLFDYISPQSLVVLYQEVKPNAEQFWSEIKARHEQLQYDATRPLCEPNEVFLSPDEFYATIKPFTQLKLDVNSKSNSQYQFKVQAQPELNIEHKLKFPLQKLQRYIESYLQTENNRIIFCAESSGRRETLAELLQSIDIKPKIYPNWQAVLADSETLGLIVSPLENGIELCESGISIITESQLFGEQVRQRSQRKQRQLDPNVMIKNLTELSIGAPVVHIQHGVGRYLGLETLTTGDTQGEYLALQYADEDKIYVPVSNLHLISRYTGADAEHAPLQRLGSKQWDKIKRKTAEQIRDVAAELLDIYGRRMAASGFSFQLPKLDYQKFSNDFAFEETPDQKNAIKDIIHNMQSENSMDRLVCGDVGFGKTEVAMRAAFIAVQNHKQVAILVPTTLLAAQHLQNFQDRFADWPVKIACLSRLQSQREQAQTLQEMKHGKVDIVIGTHKLLSDDIQFKNLGLLIVDEEQRFGVRQKERITSLRAEIDILTLTATPIPRTLNMAMAGTRDLSIIATPPARRLAVKTFVHESNNSLIREAILRETLRGGQIYFLHNDVSSIPSQVEQLRELVPEARITFAHGQMRESELERVMSDFYHQRFNVLVCSTIIESGIDIPSANTIIINRADKFGLSQLHQLRGRVGRSHHQAYAYLLTPPKKAMTKDALKRLDAIALLGDLGIGFSLATHDLEIRGAGELLGEEQSGQIHAIGFTLYMELLEEAVAALKSGREPEFDKPLAAGSEIELNIPALLPNEYVNDVQLRLTLYKRLANCKSKTEIQDFKAELIDRFGLLPEAAQNLFQLSEIKRVANELGIVKVEHGSKYGYLHFGHKPNIQTEKLISLIQLHPKQYQLQGADTLRFVAENKSAQEKIDIVLNIFDKIKK